MISYPSSLSLTYTASFSNIATNTSITFSSVTGSDLVGSGTITIPGINILTPPSTRTFLVTVTSQTLIGGVPYGINSRSLSFSCQPGSIYSTSVVPTITNVNALTQYVLTFTIANSLINGSFVSILFPSELTATIGSCTTNNANSLCSVTNTSYAQLSIIGGISSNATMIVTFPSVKNPKQAQTTGSFQIYTYYDSGFDSLVDRVTSGITMTSIANSIPTGTITPTSKITYAQTTYTFAVTLSDAIPANGYIQIAFPSTITLGSVAINNASFASNNCTISITSNNVTINSCFNVDMTTLNLSMILSGIFNPPSLQTTSSFSFSAFGPLGLVNYLYTNLTVTMITPATTTSFTISPLTSTVHSFSQYNLGFTFAVPHQIGDYFLFSIPSSMVFITGVSCSALLGINSTNCLLQNTTTLKINLNGVPLSSAQISIATIRNYDIAVQISFQAYFYNSANFAM